MNFSDRITFVTIGESYYDSRLGEYVEDNFHFEKRPCHLSALGVDRTREIFGTIDRVVTVARLQQPYERPFDYVLIDGQRYNVLRESQYRKGVLFLEGVRHGVQLSDEGDRGLDTSIEGEGDA